MPSNDESKDTDQAVGPVPPSPSAITRVDEPSETEENRVSKWDVISSIINIGLHVYSVYRNIDTERYIYLTWTIILFLFASVRTFYSYVITCVKKQAPPNEALLGIFVCFLENVPEKVIRFTELLSNPHGPIDLVAFPFRMISMGLSVANYHRTIERVQTDTTNIDRIDAIIESILHSFVIASRIVCICVAANICFGCTVGACILHWAAMTIWLVADTHGVAEFSKDISGIPLLELANCKGFGQLLLALSLGFIYIFTYVNPSRRSTNSRNVYYDVASFVENVIAAILWLIYSGDTLKDQWFYVTLAMFCVLVPAVCMIWTIIAYMCVGKTNAAPTEDRTHPPSYESQTRSQSQTHPVQSESAHNTLSTPPDELSNSSGSVTTDSAIDNRSGPFANPDGSVPYRRTPRATD